MPNDILSNLIPSINQTHDVAGLVIYRTGIHSEIVIEHRHRYNTFCALNTLSTKDITRDYPSILPTQGQTFVIIESGSNTSTVHQMQYAPNTQTASEISPASLF
ncbi:MAG: hypothetical protein AB7V37_08925 [Eubacteriaceae bacterium]|jgi:hypothetical protein